MTPTDDVDGSSRPRVYLQAGEVFASATPAEVTTVLGSCVAVCLFSPATGVGGLNHFLLPAGADGSPRFGDAAIRLLVDRVLALGAPRGDLVAKLFGGAGTMGRRGGAPTVGEQNTAVAARLLEEERIPVQCADVGGERGRKLVFRTDSGEAFVLRL